MITLTAKFYFADFEYEVNRRNQLEINAPQLSRGDIKMPEFNIYSNSGTIRFMDYDSTISDLTNANKLSEGIKCEVFLNNTLTNTYEVVAEMKVSNWHYNNDSREVTATIKDELEEWQNIQVEKIDVPFIDAEGDIIEHRAYTYLNVWYQTIFYPLVISHGYNLLPFNSLDEVTRAALSNFRFMYPFLNPCSLWEFGRKICVATASRIYKSGRNIILKYSGGS